MKNKINKLKGFTLVELLIVIALIAILSVAVLATINPIEQSNKARDAKVQNDAAEVLSAYERYYAGKNSYPWLDVAVTTDTVDTVFYGLSNQTGSGLCGNAAAVDYHSVCTTSVTSGLLVSTDELKSSFLSKGYTVQSGDATYKAENILYVVKQATATGNNIYVCYVPKAKANRANSGLFKLKALSVDNASKLPTAIIDATAVQITAATYASIAANDTLFRCVPE